MHTISLEELFTLQKKKAHCLVDVRSPIEYHDATIPGSINIPVFTTEERAEVGTIYKQVGQQAAKKRGLEIFSKKLPDFIAAFEALDKPFTVFCWRGGMRSKTAATVLDLMGIHANRLNGGIRTYRKWVVQQLENYTFRPAAYVLNGYTGSGKTTILHLLKNNGLPTIDLEGLAGHRGSIFGQIGLEPRNQRKFDSLLITELNQLQQEPFVFLEGESKRIGKVLLPDCLFEKKQQGTQFFIQLPMEERVKNILADYQPDDDPERFLEAFQYIKRRIHQPIAKQIEEALLQSDFPTAIKLLLEYYYDPRYEYAVKDVDQEERIYIAADTAQHAAEQIMNHMTIQHHEAGT